MALAITDKPNTDPIDADYPYGNIRDRIGTTPGTPVSQEVYADFHQFFARIMALAEVTPNGLPDNAYSGFQLVEALFKVINRQYRECVLIVEQTGTSAPVVNVVFDTFQFVGGFTTSRSAQGLYEITTSLPGLDSFNYLTVLPSAGDPDAPAGSIINTTFSDGKIYINTKNSGGFDADSILSRYIIWIKDFDPLLLP